MSETTTNGVCVLVTSRYVPERSDPSRQEFFFSYHVQIRNDGEATVTLRSRHWVITDAFGNVKHVRGAGVVGDQPRLSPGDAYEYQSACPLGTPHGSMQGSYQMVTEGGETFDAEIAPFALSVPGAEN